MSKWLPAGQSSAKHNNITTTHTINSSGIAMILLFQTLTVAVEFLRAASPVAGDCARRAWGALLHTLSCLERVPRALQALALGAVQELAGRTGRATMARVIVGGRQTPVQLRVVVGQAVEGGAGGEVALPEVHAQRLVHHRQHRVLGVAERRHNW